jgi:hypothetical protein
MDADRRDWEVSGRVQPRERGPVEHPRALAAFRVVLYSVAAAVVVGLVGLGLSVLGATVALAGLSLFLTGEPNAVVLGLVAVAGLLTTGGVALAVGLGARRLDRHVTESDRRPDPLEELKRAYVAGALDDATFERRVDRVLTGESVSPRRGQRSVWSRSRDRVAAVRARLQSRRSGAADRTPETELT